MDTLKGLALIASFIGVFATFVLSRKLVGSHLVCSYAADSRLDLQRTPSAALRRPRALAA